MVELSFEDEFKLLSDELGRIFSSNFLDELAKNHKIKQRKGKLEPLDFVSFCSFFNEGSVIKSLSRLCALLTAERNHGDIQNGISIVYQGNLLVSIVVILKDYCTREIVYFVLNVLIHFPSNYNNLSFQFKIIGFYS
ncbi:hypothetical protein V7201_06925 [Bacillus sp. JJ1122]|uniref:hypothetical protein n=1 Tax=Bacillus sp. JJ1122 TaxID=3122951 RepID=UPI002FFE2FE1